MTANEFIYAVREKLKAYVDDTKYTDDYIMYLGNLKRALYIRRDYNQLQRTIDEQVLQTICMELEEVDSSDCPECEELGGYDCDIIRTIKKLPGVIELHNRSTIRRISSVGIQEAPFSIVSRSKFNYSGESKYERNIIFATLHSNGHIYLKSKSDFHRTLDYISVTALFEKPEAVQSFNCDIGDCYDPTVDEWPTKYSLVDIIISEIVAELANLKAIREDNRNNDKEDN